MEHIWTMLMHKVLQAQLLRAFVANLKIDEIYALYPESFCDKNLAIRKVFAFSDSEYSTSQYPPVHPSPAQYNPVPPSTAQYIPVHPSTTQ